MIQLSVLTLEKEIFTGPVKSISLPGRDGWLTILSGHIPLLTSLKSGIVSLETETGEEKIEIEKGFFEMRGGNEAVILATQVKQ